MKKIIYIISVLILLSFSRCYDLDTYPGDKVSQNHFWKTEAEVHQGMMGVYSGLRALHVYGLSFMMDNLGEIGTGYDAASYQIFYNGNYTERSEYLVSKWQTMYEMVQRSNIFLRNVENLSFLTDEDKAAYKAEAKFMRAMFYFTLSDFFGAVPYYDESFDINTDYNKMMNPRSSTDDIRTYILADLEEAIKYLPLSRPDGEYGRVTKGAAYALRGKVYLYNKQWDKAIADFEEIVYNKTNNYGYDLHADYAELFKLYGKAKSKETIFSIQNLGTKESLAGMPFAFYLGTRSTYGSCWNNGMPSTDLVDMYEYPDGKPFNWDDAYPGFNAATVDARRDILDVKLETQKINGKDVTVIGSLLNADTTKIINVYRNRDPRLMATVITPYSNYVGWDLTNLVAKNMMLVCYPITGTGPNEAFGFIRNNSGSWTGSYLWRKFVPEGNLGGDLTDRSHTPFQFPLIRLADVLLMLSEAYNESGNLGKAVTELNKVRARESVSLPGINSGATWLAVTTQQEMRERIYQERAVELACEGHRFSDLRRWGIAKKVLAGRPIKNIYGASITAHKFEDRDMLWPIPGEEIVMNPALLPNNPGWGN